MATEGEAKVRALGDLEAAVMEVVWSRGPSTVREVMGGLGPGKARAYTTVMTVMGRLAEKGLLERERSGRVDVYRAALGREEFGSRRAASAVRGLLDEYGDAALAQFAAALEDADPERMARLRARFGRSPEGAGAGDGGGGE